MDALTLFTTTVVLVERSALGTRPDVWQVVHRCRSCRNLVVSEALIDHARQHAG